MEKQKFTAKTGGNKWWQTKKDTLIDWKHISHIALLLQLKKIYNLYLFQWQSTEAYKPQTTRQSCTMKKLVGFSLIIFV